jgi:hypothetical protein
LQQQQRVLVSVHHKRENVIYVRLFFAAVTAWKEFHGTEKKLTRYGGTIEKIKSTLLWWHQLTEIEQANVSNSDRLVFACEDAFEREREAWMSTSMATKAITAAAGQNQATNEESPKKEEGQNKVKAVV